jgi:hypothetical protein
VVEIRIVYTLPFYESTLLVHFIAKVDEAVSTTLAGYSIGNDLSRLARGKAGLKVQYKKEIVNLGVKVTDENAVLGRQFLLRTIDLDTSKNDRKILNKEPNRLLTQGCDHR